jgi:hypothetical protein
MSRFQIASIASLLAVSVASAQLPPGLLHSGRPAQPGSVPPAQAIQPVVPANPAPAPVQPLPPVVPETPIPAPQVPEEPSAPAARTDFQSSVPNTLVPEEQAQGWKLLFDGQRLLGLRGVQRSSPLSSGWVVASGELNLPKSIKNMDRVTGGDLITTEQYWDFEFRFEWKASVSADSGVRYMIAESGSQTPPGLEYQIIDDVHSPLGLKGGLLRRSGALDNVLPVGRNARLRSADPLNKIGDPWNEGRIVVQGTHVEHWLNGDKVLEFELGPQLRRLAEANKAKVPFTFGNKVRTRICILDQGTEVAFRNLKIRPLIPQAVIAPPQSQKPVPNPLLLPPGAGR